MFTDRNPELDAELAMTAARSGSSALLSTLVARIALVVMSAVSMTALISCIDRSNPFDPVNAGPEAASDVRKSDQARLDSLAAGESAYTASLAADARQFAADSGANSAVAGRNSSRRSANDAARAHNAAVESANAAAPVDSLREKSAYVYLDTLAAYGPYAGFAAQRAALLTQSARAFAYMVQANAGKAPLIVYPQAFIDSVLAPFARDSAAFAAFQAAVDRGNAAVTDSNGIVRAYNAALKSANDSVDQYNAIIDYRRSTAAKPIITRSDSLQAGTVAAKAGDSLNLGPGRFDVDLRFGSSGTADSPIVVRGYPGLATVLHGIAKDTSVNGSAAILSGRSYIRFEGIVFRGGGISGIKLESGSRNVVFRNCRFDSSGQWGLEVIDSDVDMQDCLVTANGGGVRISAPANSDLRARLSNVLVAKNRGTALEAVSPMGDVLNCTFADNAGDGIHVISPLRALVIANTIVSGNAGTGIIREPTNLNQEGFSVKECDVWGNRTADWNLAGMDSSTAASLIKANLNADPGYIDAASLDYAPGPGSPLAAYENQALPVIIGYRPK